MPREPADAATLYESLANTAPVGAPRGETIRTKAKETLDNDAEVLNAEEVAADGNQRR